MPTFFFFWWSTLQKKKKKKKRLIENMLAIALVGVSLRFLLFLSPLSPHLDVSPDIASPMTRWSRAREMNFLWGIGMEGEDAAAPRATVAAFGKVKVHVRPPLLFFFSLCAL
jgi:hypothetical protein